MSAPHLTIPPSPDTAPTTPPRRRRPLAGDEEDTRALVRFIAASPNRIGWLREHVAAQLDRVAVAVAESDPPTVDVAAAAIRTRAAAHRRGETPLW